MSLATPRAQPAIALSRLNRGALASLCALAFAVPIRIAVVGEVEIPLAVLLVAMGIPALCALPRIAGGPLLIVAAGLALASVCAWDISSKSINSTHPYLSFLFFFMPYLAYGAGYLLVPSREELRRFVSISAFVASVSGIVMLATLALSGLPVRVEGDILGSLGGLPLYATHGVNSLAITEYIMFAFVWIDLLFHRSSTLPVVLLKTLGLGSLGVLVFLSLSRGAVLACAVFIVLSLAFLAVRRPVVAGAILAVFIGAGLYIGAAYGDALSAAWGTRVDQATASLSEGETNDLTSGRLTLAASAVADLTDSPIFGVGFTGFHEGRSAFTETDALNSSPHNQYLTMLWKPGVLAGGALLAFLYQCMVHLARLRRAERDKETYVGLWCMAIGVLGVASFTWDVLLVPNIGAIMLFLFGACAAIVTHQAPPEVG